MNARRRTLVARLDSVGDVLLAGPAIRAIAASDDVVLLTSRIGAPAAGLLPGVGAQLTFDAPWILADPPPVDRPSTAALIRQVVGLDVERAVILTSFHQSALPLALLLRLAGVPWIGAASDDYPGALLDVRHVPDDDRHEVERSLAVARACGYDLPDGDRGRLAVALDHAAPLPWLPASYVVVHPGASAPARTWAPERFANLVEALRASGRAVVVTGSAHERRLTARTAGPGGHDVVDLGGALDLPTLARVLDRADVVVTGNTGPAHLAAAVGTPVVSLFAPTVPAHRWRPWKVPHVLLGDQRIVCAGCRARTCPFVGHPCLGGVPVSRVVAAVEQMSVARAGSPGLFHRPHPDPSATGPISSGGER